MSIAITDEHQSLGATVSDFLVKNDSRGATRQLLTAETEALPGFWPELANLGWLGLHLPEEYGGSGFTVQELAVVIEPMGRTACPGPFVPTVIASAVINAAGDDDLKKSLLPGLADGSRSAAIGLTKDA